MATVFDFISDEFTRATDMTGLFARSGVTVL